MDSDTEAVRALYEKRESTGAEDYWHPLNPGAAYFRQALERALVAAVNAVELDLPALEILDIGCGDGDKLRFLMSLGADPAKLHGVDLMSGRIATARQRSPQIDFRVESGSALPFDDGTLDVVSQFTAASASPTRMIVPEMRRLVRPGGLILWFDLTQPGRSYYAITEDEVRELFTGFRVEFRRTLYHRWTGRLAGRVPLACAAIETLPVEKSNLMLLLRAPRKSLGRAVDHTWATDR